MNTQDLLERSAERGEPRGAAQVWAAAQPGIPQPDSGRPSGSAMVLRAAIVLWVVGLIAAGVMRSSTADTSSPVADAATQDDADPVEPSEALPAPLLIDGGTLKRDGGGVSRPAEPRFDGADIFAGIAPEVPSSDIPVSRFDLSRSTVIFADLEDPFGGPIVGVEQLAGGGYRPWAANLDGAVLADFTQYLVQLDGDWSIADDSGLGEVARFDDDAFNPLRFGWQFVFELDSDDEITLQAETTSAGVVDEWLWVARLAGQARSEATVTPIEVLGQEGIVIDRADASGDDGVVWFSDGFVYRMTASHLDGDTSLGRDSVGDIGRLRLVGRAEWVDAIAASVRPPFTVWAVVLPGFLVVFAAAISTLFFSTKKPLRAAALVVVAGAAVIGGTWAFFALSPADLAMVALFACGLGLAWWRHRTPVTVNGWSRD